MFFFFLLLCRLEMSSRTGRREKKPFGSVFVRLGDHERCRSFTGFALDLSLFVGKEPDLGHTGLLCVDHGLISKKCNKIACTASCNSSVDCLPGNRL